MNQILAIDGSLLTVIWILAGILIACIVAYFSVEIYIESAYRKARRTKTEIGLTGKEAAEAVLRAHGITDVTVVKTNIFSAMFYGNSYSTSRKRIRLTRRIFDKTTVNAVAMGTQKAEIAAMHADGDRQVISRGRIAPWVQLAPVMFLPSILIGLVIDLAIFNSVGVWTIVFTGLGLLYFIGALVFQFLNLKVEKRANNNALATGKTLGLFTEEEEKMAIRLFKAYQIKYLLEFISLVFYVLIEILKIINSIVSKKK